ncbi:hypothetical protein K432DRAFT_292874 [Lepidopterella palustris CBS 459.81]|uniref:Cytoplasmic tRNA 2-thiolation protein 2 n=1 Tax=Lepidopterella palustris CBS 459.81 TaxID=1314670 RepID=A0A8E2EF27_9PEZI|nr:hypothetical protein K432DRAFT_292874 [Lepidopterella palustris CBS 459.81]
MPSKHIPQDTAAAGHNCRRCRIAEASLIVRAEPLCRDCFIKYIHTKVIKRMEAFRVRHSSQDQIRTLLLPVSFGVSSVTLLHLLDHHLKGQKEKTKRTGFGLRILFVDTSAVERDSPDAGLICGLRDRFPDHSYSTINLEDVFEIASGNNENEPSKPSETSNGHDTIVSAENPLEQLLSSMPSATARSDVISTLRTKLIARFAKENGCEGILWGDTTTKLAERTLSETAKGRGFSLPWQVCDGESPVGITYYYPLRDVLKKELVAHAELVDPALSPLIFRSSNPTQLSTNSKNTTIDDLMKQYFESVEENYPSIVANVVRTVGKLEAAPSQDPSLHCRLCNMPVSDGKFGIHGWGGDQHDSEVVSLDTPHGGLCYGCTRSIPQETKLLP